MPPNLASALLDLVAIAPGRFTMGSPETEAGRFAQEGPQTAVSITRPFWLGRTSVTVGQWGEIMGTTLAEQAAKVLADDREYDFWPGTRMVLRDFYQKKRESDPRSLLSNTDERAPMHFVNWEEARQFCRRLNERERTRLPAGHEYRLPTDAEREYACRAGTATATYNGDLEIGKDGRAPILDPIAWYFGNSADGYAGPAWDTAVWPAQYIPHVKAGPRRVGEKRPNPWGLHDMIGNVYEFCQDWYADRLPGGSVADPTGPGAGTKHIVRGGAWGSLARLLRAGYRDGDEPTRRSMFLGFRVALGPVVRVPAARLGP